MHSALQREIDQTMATLATPLEEGQPVRAAVDVVRNDEGKMRYQAYWGRDGMRKKEHFGPLFDYPREANAFVDDVNRRAGLVVVART
jgi:hypothetical protein